MKKQLTVALGLAVLATPAFATKARLQALGEDIYGSYYINDNRNIWLNPAQITNHKDLVTFEWGDASGSGTAADVDTNASPRAEGGVNKAYGNMVYGLHLGSASNTANALRLASGVTATEENNIDLFVGGDAGLKWGANLGYSSSSDDETATNESKQESMRTRLGVIMGDTQAFANISIMNEAEGGAQDQEFDGELGYQVGVIHAWQGNSIFADYRSFNAEVDGAADGDIMLKQLLVGMGRVERLNDKANLYAKIQYQMVDTENEASTDNFGAGNCGGLTSAPFCEEYKSQRIPVVIGLEHDSASWLTLRASVGQVIWGSEEDKDDERPVGASTFVNAGATLKFGELSVDGVIGNGDGGLGSTGDSTAAGNGTLRTDVLMTRVGMVYRF